MKSYEVQRTPFKVPAEGNKLIEEHFGHASIKAGDFSFAHMKAPAGWGEPYQSPEFDEITYVISGTKLIEIDGEELTLNAGESICVKKGTRVRYSNPFSKECEYVSVCIPAFDINKVHRES